MLALILDDVVEVFFGKVDSGRASLLRGGEGLRVIFL